MERRNARPTREIVVPGDVLDGTGMKPGENAYVLDGKVRASVMGVGRWTKEFVPYDPEGKGGRPAAHGGGDLSAVSDPG